MFDYLYELLGWSTPNTAEVVNENETVLPNMSVTVQVVIERKQNLKATDKSHIPDFPALYGCSTTTPAGMEYAPVRKLAIPKKEFVKTLEYHPVRISREELVAQLSKMTKTAPPSRPKEFLPRSPVLQQILSDVPKVN